MVPRQLGMQRNAAMYSNAKVWMQTFDCCCMLLRAFRWSAGDMCEMDEMKRAYFS